MTTNTAAATFTPDTMTINGQTFAAGYSVTPTGTVFVFVTVQEDGQEVKMRIKVTPDDPNYAAAVAAAQPAAPEVTAQEPEQEPAASEAIAQEPEQEPAAPEAIAQEPEQEPAAPEAIAQEPEQEQERDPKQARGPVPEKSFIGQEITGNGWKIVFDGNNERTRIIIEGDPKKAAEEAINKAGFYWSPVMKSFNKKLTFKAFRAAQALAQDLQAIYA